MSFSQPVDLIPYGEIYKLNEDVEYYLESNHDAKIKFKKGLEFNGASVPWFLEWFVKRYGEIDNAALVHDFLYQSKLVDRKTADLEFLHIMKITGVSKWKRNVIFVFVRALGWLFH